MGAKPASPRLLADLGEADIGAFARKAERYLLADSVSRSAHPGRSDSQSEWSKTLSICCTNVFSTLMRA
jgi:hypothetical protein